MIEIFKNTDCDKDFERSALPAETVPAMAYVPFQQWETPYEATRGFGKGTIFPVLDKPFTGMRGEVKWTSNKCLKEK